MKIAAKIGLMGSADPKNGNLPEIDALASQLAKAIAESGCALITGETSGFPGRVAQEASEFGALTIGVSAAHSAAEHKQLYNTPPRSSDVVIYTGFGLKGRNVISVRSADIVVIFSGSMGTLNEFTVAYDEGKIIGVLEGTGGVADELRGLVERLAKKTKATVLFERSPSVLVNSCLAALEKQRTNS